LTSGTGEDSIGLDSIGLDSIGAERSGAAIGAKTTRSLSLPRWLSAIVVSVPVGGKQLVILNSELRFPLGISAPLVGGALGGAVFYDGGNVYTNVQFTNIFPDFTHTLGFGLRYKTPVGPVRIDIGHLLNAPPGVKSLQFFVTLGQSF